MVFEFNTPGIARIVAAAGAEFVIFDMEHTGWSIETIRALMATARAADVVPMVRVPATEYHLIARPLDVGASGVMVPMVETEEQARLVVASAKYPPQGGAAPPSASPTTTTRAATPSPRCSSANDGDAAHRPDRDGQGRRRTSRRSPASRGSTCSGSGTSTSPTRWASPASSTTPTTCAAVDRVLEACDRHGKAPGIMATSVEDARAQLEQGFRCVAYWGDIWLYAQALRGGLEAIREG